jgi:DNA invertase Pin-like site-specific DNA recombinase
MRKVMDTTVKLTGNAYSYIRFSSERQQLGDSLRRQLKLAEDFAARHNLNLDTHTYRDLGVSAFKGKNAIEGKLGTFIKAVDDGVIKKGSILLVESLDRISRAQVDEAIILFLSIIHRGIKIVTLADQQIYSSERLNQDKGMSLIISLSYMMRAHEESAMKSSRIKAVWSGRVENWKPGTLLPFKAPTWLRKNEAKTGFDIIPEKAEIVERIYKMAADGFGQIKIVNALVEDKVPTMESAKFWTQGVVGAILRNPAVMGTFSQGKTGADEIENYYPAIVPKDMWLRVQDAIKNRRRIGGTKSNKVSNLFSGVSFCLYCGGRTRYVPTGDGTKSYVHCLFSYSGKGCPARPFPYKAAETAVLDRLMNAQLRMLDNKFESEEANKRLMYETEIEQLKKKQEAAISVMLDMPDVTPLKNELKRIQDRIATAEKKLSELAHTPVTDHEASEAGKLFRKHQRMVEEGDESVADLRRAMQSSIRRLIRKIEFASDLQRSELWAKDGASIFDGMTSRFHLSDEPDFILRVTFASGNVRIIDATPYINERSKASRTAARKRREE